MEHDDPWDWSTDRVVLEFCTTNRSWPLRSAAMVIPDPVPLSQALREQEVTGDSLLNDIDDAIMRNEFGLRTIGQRAYVSHGINALRRRSAKYQAKLHANHPESVVASKLSRSVDEIAELIRRCAPGFPPVPQQQQQREGEASAQNLAKFLAGTPESFMGNNGNPEIEDIVSDAGGKRQKLDIPNPEANLEPSFAEYGDEQMETSEHNDQQRMLAPAPEPIEPASSGKKRKRIAPTLITSEIDPNRYRELPTAADAVIINDPDSNHQYQNTGPTEDETIQPEDSIQHDELIQPEDDIQDDEVDVSSKVEPGVMFVDENGRKRLIPVFQAGSEPSKQAEGSTTSKTTSMVKFKPPKRSPGYLGRRKMAVDELFYPGTAVGEDLPKLEDSAAEFSIMPSNIPKGQRLYVHDTMKRFLRSDRQDFVRDGEILTAIVPYAEKLTLRYQKQSFSLFYTNETGAHVRREEVQAWPEISISATTEHYRMVDGHVSSFYPTGPGILDELGRYEETFDPSYLENKYKYLEGGDEVLTVYGHSDEENEYDVATWKEIEEERGEMLRPIGRTSRKHISLDEIEEAIDEGIAELVARWTVKKLPKLYNKGYRLWRKSRKDGDKRIRIVATQEDLKNINRRIANMRKEILEDVWTRKAQVLKQIPIMEVDVFTREELCWMIRILEQDVCPEKRPHLLPTCSVDSKTPLSIDPEEGESINSEGEASSSDDGLGDFLVDDDGDVLPSTEQELYELNLAESEDDPVEDEEEADAVMSDDSLSDRPRNPHVKPTVAKTIRLEQPRSTPFSSLSPIGTPVKWEQPSLPPLPRNGGHQETEVYDLTMLSSDDSAPAPVVDLVTPLKPKIKLKVKSSSLTKATSPVTVVDSDEDPMPDDDDLPALDNPSAVSKFSYVVWAKLLDRQRLIIRVFYKMQPPLRRTMLDFISNLSQQDLWGHMSTVINAYKGYFSRPKSENLARFPGVKGMDTKTFEVLAGYVRLFEIYIDCSYHAWREEPDVWSIRKFSTVSEYQFKLFFDLCIMLQDIFPNETRTIVNHISSEDDEDDEDARLPLSAKRRSRDITDGEDDVPESSQKRKRVKPVFENAEARDKRAQVMHRLEEQQKRRMILQANLKKHGHENDESQGRIIINDAADVDEHFHYINPHIASRIKKHQIDGVRFMWNQIVAGGVSEELLQGCLLAHTMGLGKTMQVITLLVAIAEAAASKDTQISKQIPEKLQRSQTLVLCPPGLIDNWMDELLTWVPNDVLGPLEKITAALPLSERLLKIAEWNQDGGVLIIGYDMFRNFITNNKRKSGTSALTDEDHSIVTKHLLESPNIIIADEAHKMKNSGAAITAATKMFKSTSRIALTGSPLANKVEEYYAMIDWVAPNYLGPIVEFKAKYVEPIQIGLWQDSTGGERRKALKMLKVLNDTLAPKVNRADMSVLRNDLPPKKEFVITVPLTEVQKKAYSLYIRSIASANVTTTKSGEITQTTIWHWLTVLSLICNHPKCFNIKIHEGKGDGRKEAIDAPSPQDNSDADGFIPGDLNTPMSKIGVSQDLIDAATELFRKEASDLESVELSYKVKILCQILDASKAAGDKILVFSSSLLTLDFLESVCQKQKRDYARLDGKTNMSKRQGMSKKFNKGSTDLFLISTNAGSLGLNLYGANRVVIFDFKFNPTVEEQAVGRAYRIGQTKPTFVYRFVAGGTFEDHIHNKTIFKMQLASRVVDKKTPVAYATRKLSEFLFEPKDVKRQDLSEFEGMDPLVMDQILASQGDLATICKIVQTDTFEKDDEDKLTQPDTAFG